MSYDQIPVQVILDAIKNEIQMMYQWSDQFSKKRVNPDYISTSVVHAHKAEALIELLEIHDCGSVGGFDEGNHGLYSLEERYAALAKKERTFLLLHKLSQE
jgi:hypothetical protein